MKKNKIPDRCRPCGMLATEGIKNNKYDRWCCRFGQVAAKVQAQCIQSGGFKPKGET